MIILAVIIFFSHLRFQSEEAAALKNKQISDILQEPLLSLVESFPGGNLDALVKHVCDQLAERFFIGETVEVTLPDRKYGPAAALGLTKSQVQGRHP